MLKFKVNIPLILCLVSFGLAQAQVVFEDKVLLFDNKEYSARPSSIAHGDVNNDGFDDLIVASTDDDKILLHKNVAGDLTAESVILVSLGQISDPSFVTSVDVDGDELMDILAMSNNQDKVYWIRNLGADQWSDANVLIQNVSSENLIVADIDGDSVKDIITVVDNILMWFKNNGGGQFGSGITIGNYGYITELYATDVENDGDLDLFFRRSSNQDFRFIRNLGNNQFASALTLVTFNGIRNVSFLDADNDGDSDIFVTGTSKQYFIKYNAGFFQSPTLISEYGTARSSVADLDQDGLIDLIALESINLLKWRKNLGNGIFSSENAIPGNFNFSEIVSIGVVDLNNDGIQDLTVSCFPSQTNGPRKISTLTASQGNLALKESVINASFGKFQHLKSADLDGDGLEDILFGCNTLVWKKNYGNGSYSGLKYVANLIGNWVGNYGGGGMDSEIADVDQDGDLDIITSFAAHLYVYLNNGSGEFTQGYVHLVTDNIRDIEYIDFNGDGIKDIVYVTHVSGKIRWIPGDGTSFGDAAVVGPPIMQGYHPGFICSGDVDGDGDVDILTLNSYGDNNMHLLRNLGNGNFALEFVFSTQYGLGNEVKLGDIDNDGDLDIVVGSSPTRKFLNDGNGNFLEGETISIQTTQFMELVDIDSDGYLDVVGFGYNQFLGSWPQNQGPFSVINNHGNGFAARFDYYDSTIGPYVSEIGVADVTGDGLLDLLVGENDSSTDAVYYYPRAFTLSTVAPGDSQNNSFSIYPNPFSESLQWSDNLIFDISIYTETGVLVSKFVKASSPIDLSNLASGLYFAKFNNNTLHFTKKIIKR